MATRTAQQRADEAAEEAGLKNGPDRAPAGLTYIATWPFGVSVAVADVDDDGRQKTTDDGRPAVKRVKVAYQHELPAGVPQLEIDTLLSLNFITAKA